MFLPICEHSTIAHSHSSSLCLFVCLINSPSLIHQNQHNILFSTQPRFTTYFISLVSLSFSQAVITKTSQSRCLGQQNALPHNSGSWKSKNIFSTCLVSTETSFIDLIMVNLLMNSITMSIYTHMHYLSKGLDTK